MLDLMVVTMGDSWVFDILGRNLRNAGISTREINLMVFVNGPTPGTSWETMETCLGVGLGDHRIMSDGQNHGFPVAANELIHAGKTEEFILVDDDVAFPAGWVKELLEVRQAVVKSGRPVGLGGIPLDAWRNDELGIQTDIRGKKLRPRATPIGGCRHLTRELIAEAGYICEGYFPCGGDDVDFCTRLAWMGKFNYHIDALRSTHEHHERSDPEYQARKKAMLARIPAVDQAQQTGYRAGRFRFMPQREWLFQ